MKQGSAINKTIIIDGSTALSYVIAGESLCNVGKYIHTKKIFIITDENIAILYKKQMPTAPIYILKSGETQKNIQTAAHIYGWLLENNADRSSFILGIGGGVVCDIAGFVATTFMRGIAFGFVATTLLAQIDAAIGGKNGVNLDGYKNIIGTINQPQFTICDTIMLKTLPADELSNGFAEMIKHTLISNCKEFEHLEKKTLPLLNCHTDIITEFVIESVAIKAAIVKADEYENGERKKLNLGHTWGHAVEKITGIPHGQAVAIGLEFAARMSVEQKTLTTKEYQRIVQLLQKFYLPTNTSVNKQEILNAMEKDKKKADTQIDFILMNGIGNAMIKRMSFDYIKTFALNT